MGTKTTLLLIFILVPLTFFVALYFFNPTYTVNLITGAKTWVFNLTTNYVQSVTQNPATAILPAIGASGFVLTLANKAYNTMKAKAAAAESFALQKQSQSLEISDALRQELQKNEELTKKLDVYEKGNTAIADLNAKNLELETKIETIQASNKTVVDSLTTQRDTIQLNYKQLLEQILTDPTLKAKYEKYVIT